MVDLLNLLGHRDGAGAGGEGAAGAGARRGGGRAGGGRSGDAAVDVAFRWGSTPTAPPPICEDCAKTMTWAELLRTWECAGCGYMLDDVCPLCGTPEPHPP